MKKKFFVPLMGALVLGVTTYAGYRTYDAYAGVDESDLLLANIETLADVDEAWNPVCYNGGPGSKSCSIGAGISIGQAGMSGNCSVSCQDGYYSCCGIRCTCKKE